MAGYLPIKKIYRKCGLSAKLQRKAESAETGYSQRVLMIWDFVQKITTFHE